MNKIKILFTIPNFDTAGSGKALLNIATGLNSDKYEVHILCLHRKGAFFKVVENSGIPVHIYPYISEARPVLKMLMECWTLSRYFKDEINPDIIHSYNYSANYTEALAAKMAGIPWVFTKKNMNWGGKSKNAWKLRSLLAKKIAVQNKDMLTMFYPKSNKTVLIPRGVDVNYFHPIQLESEAEAVLPLFPLGQRLLICVANFVPVKGIEILIQTFYRLNEKHKNWSLLLVGDDSNEYGLQLHNEVAQLKMKERIKFSGKLLDVRPQLARSEIFILPTKNEGRREGSPVAILEAMAAEKVVLGSNIPGIRDQLEVFPDFMFEPSNIEDLMKKLDKLMVKPRKDLKIIGCSFRSHVTSNYPLEKEIEKHENLYDSIIEK